MSGRVEPGNRDLNPSGKPAQVRQCQQRRLKQGRRQRCDLGRRFQTLRDLRFREHDRTPLAQAALGKRYHLDHALVVCFRDRIVVAEQRDRCGREARRAMRVT